MAAVTDVLVPDLGEAADVTVVEVLVAPGAVIGVEDPLVTLESDKATMDVPSPVAGTVQEVLVAAGDGVGEGSRLLTVSVVDAAAPAPAPAAQASPPAEDAGSPEDDRERAGGLGEREQPGGEAGLDDGPHASPLARRLARELDLDLADVAGTARQGRISKDDVLAHAGGEHVAEAVSPPLARPVPVAEPSVSAPSAPVHAATVGPGAPQVDFGAFGEVERVELSRIKRLVGANLHRNWVDIPHVTHHDEADVTDLEAFRVRVNEENAEGGVKLTMVGLLLKACVAALKAHPEVNSSLDGGALVLKRYFHLGMATDTPRGLVVPVIRDVDRKGLLELAAEVQELAGKARSGRLSPEEMQGGTFTISSLGGIGGTGFTPIVNAPEVAILGVTRAATKPVWDGREFRPRLMLPLSLSYDHRVVDGVLAARFTRTLAGVLHDLRSCLL